MIAQHAIVILAHIIPRIWYNHFVINPVQINPRIMHGQPCFAGTRVTVQTLFDHLEGGYTINQFLEQFPTVSREQVISLLAELKLHVDQSAKRSA